MKINKKLIIILIFLCSIFYLSIGALQGIGIYDEGFVLQNSLNIVKGQIPYRDFWSPYSPGHYYLLALLFKLFGPYVIVNRVLDIIVRLLLASSVFIISFKLSSVKYAILSYVITLLMLGSVGFFGYPMFSALLLSLINVYFVFKFLDTKKNKNIFYSGLAIGAVTLFRHDFGIYCFLSTIIILFSHSLFERSELLNKEYLIKQLVIFSKKYFAFILGFLIIFFPAFLYFVTEAGIMPLYNDLVGYPIFVLNGFRRLPYPPLFPNLLKILLENNYSITKLLIFIKGWMGFYFPVFIYIFIGIYIILKSKLKNKDKKTKINFQKYLFLTIFGLFLFLQSLSRADDIHFFATTIIAIILLNAFLGFFYLKLISRSFPIKILLFMVLFFLFNIYISYPFYNWSKNAYNVFVNKSRLLSKSDIKRSIFILLDSDQSSAILYIQKYVPKDEYIYVGLSRHDKVFINDIAFYFLADRTPPTKYYIFNPGSLTKEVQNEIINQLIVKRVRYLVLFSKYANYNESNMSSISNGVTILDKFIGNNYKQVQNYGNYKILLKQ